MSNITPERLSMIHDMDAEMIINMVTNSIASIIANIQDPAQRAKSVQLTAELQYEMMTGIGADPAIPRDVIISALILRITERIEMSEELYAIKRKIDSAPFN